MTLIVMKTLERVYKNYYFIIRGYCSLLCVNSNDYNREKIMNLIAAVDNNWAIGKNNQLLVRIPMDQKFSAR